MTATVFRQSCMTQHPFLFAPISYYAIVFSFALIFANGWFTVCDCLLAESHETINHYHRRCCLETALWYWVLRDTNSRDPDFCQL